jgi:CRISPR/Cas system-associated endonuclease/helicase Cas3
VLVCTSVIEVGLNVPDASVCIVEHAEYFGLSQLHQLRGRIARSSKIGPDGQPKCVALSRAITAGGVGCDGVMSYGRESFCVLLFDDGVAKAGERLQVMKVSVGIPREVDSCLHS